VNDVAGGSVPFSPTDQFRDIVRRVLYDQDRTFDPRLVADQLGVTYRVMMHWVGDDPTRRFPAELVPKFCTVVQNFGPLDYLEQQVGRLAFEVPAAEPASNRDVRDAHRLMKETTEAIGSLLKALEDGFIEEREAEHVMAELDDVIRQCVKVRYWLAQQTKRRVSDLS
jgi:hypothetical protein